MHIESNMITQGAYYLAIPSSPISALCKGKGGKKASDFCKSLLCLNLSPLVWFVF